PPAMTSSPASAAITSRCFVPTIASLPAVPTIVATWLPQRTGRAARLSPAIAATTATTRTTAAADRMVSIDARLPPALPDVKPGSGGALLGDRFEALADLGHVGAEVVDARQCGERLETEDPL